MNAAELPLLHISAALETDANSHSKRPPRDPRHVESTSGTIHASDCRALGRSLYKGVAPDIAEADVAEFIQVRHMVACGVCLRKFVAVMRE